jgi:hypothetical protein
MIEYRCWCDVRLVSNSNLEIMKRYERHERYERYDGYERYERYERHVGRIDGDLCLHYCLSPQLTTDGPHLSLWHSSRCKQDDAIRLEQTMGPLVVGALIDTRRKEKEPVPDLDRRWIVLLV